MADSLGTWGSHNQGVTAENVREGISHNHPRRYVSSTDLDQAPRISGFLRLKDLYRLQRLKSGSPEGE